MRFLMELGLTSAALYIAVGAFLASFRITDGPWLRPHRFRAAALPLVAVLAGWVLTYWLWHPLTGHYSYEYPWFYWFLFSLACVAALVTWLAPGGVAGLAHYVELAICVGLLIFEAFYVGWFGPSWADWHHVWWHWVIFAVLLLVFLAAVARSLVSWLAVVVATLVVIGLLIYGGVTDHFAPEQGATCAAPCTTSSGSGPSSSGGNKPSANGGLTQQQKEAQQEAQQSLIVNYDQVNIDQSVTLVKKYFGAHSVVAITEGNSTIQSPKFDVGAEHPVGNGPNDRLWSDAVNVPLKPQNLEAEQATIARDPQEAAMVMNGMGKAKVGGISVYQQNPWMQAQGNPDNIRPWVQHCMVGNEKHPTAAEIATHLQCARVMAATADLLGRFQSEGVQKRSSIWNYHLTHGGLAVNKVPAVGLNPKQEQNAYFLVVSMTEKTGGCFLRFGFNMGTTTRNGGDQRLAGLTCVPPKAPPKHVVPPKATPPGHTSTPTHPAPAPSSPTQPVHHGCSYYGTCHTSTPTHPAPAPSSPTHSAPPKTCYSVYGPGYSGTYPNCHKDGSRSVQPTQPKKAPGPNPAPSPVPTTDSNGSPTTQPTSSQCYDTTGAPWYPGDPNPKWKCS